MADEITDSIDRMFGALDRAFDTVGAIFGRAEETGRKADKARADVERRRADKAGVEKRKPFRIDEVIDAETGDLVFIVTNGTDKAECSSMAMAKTMLERLEGAR